MILQRYILREIAVTLTLTVIAVVSVMLIGALFQIFRRFEGPALTVLVPAVPLLLAYIAPYAILISAVAAPTLTYGRLSGDNEVDAMRACGFSIHRILLPALAVAILMMGGAHVINEHVAPKAHFARRVLLLDAVVMIMNDPPAGPNTIRIGANVLSYRRAKDGVFEGLIVVRVTRVSELPVETLTAARGVMEEGPDRSLVLRLTRVRYEKHDKDRPQRGAAETLTYPLEIEGAKDLTARPEDMTREELLEFIGTPKRSKRHVRWAQMTYYDRYGRTLAVFLLFMVGTCVGLLSRRSNRLAGFGVALPCVVGYFVLWSVGRGLGEESVLSPALAAFLPVGALLLLLIGLLIPILRR